jgi:hypothetical protein
MPMAISNAERKILGLLAAAFLIGVAWVAFIWVSDNNTARKYKTIHIGMSECDLFALMGEPDRRDIDEDKQYIYYYLRLHPVHYEIVLSEGEVKRKEVLSFP